MRDQAASFGQAQLARAAETINAGLVEMRGATSPRLQLELICAQVLLPGESDLLARLERLERALASGAPVSQAGPARGAAHPEDAPAASAAPARRAAPSRPAAQPRPAAPSRPAARPEPAAQPEPAAKPEPAAAADQPRAEAAAPVAPGAPDAGALRERWPMILDAVKHEKRVAWLLLSNASVDSLADGVLTLRFTREGEAKGFSGSGYDQELGRVLQNMLGISPRVRAVAAPGGGAGSSGAGGPDITPDEDQPEDTPGSGTGGYGDSGAGGRGTASAGGPGRAGGAPGRAGSGGGVSGRAGSGGGTPARGGTPGPGTRGDPETLTGIDLIQHSLGGEVIDETGGS
jgi:DNA polymerase-3 subunit gamma/tau